MIERHSGFIAHKKIAVSNISTNDLRHTSSGFDRQTFNG